MPKTRRKNQASIDYWRKREEAAKAAYVKEEAEYQKQVDEIYRNMYAEIQNEINAFYGKYAAAEGITIAEAKKRVSQLDIDEYSRKAERYVREKNFSKIANEEMKLYNLTMKVNRLELLKAKINLELVAGFDEVEKKTAEALLKRTMDEYKRQAGILGDSVGNQSKSASLIVNASFHNATFSEDIWMYQDALRNSLNTLLQRGMVQGKHPRELARDIEKQFGSSRYEAERLMRTELSRVQTEAAKETFKANDYGQYIFLPHSDACSVCLGIRDEVYNVADMEIGVNAPPMHPNCRCSIAAYMDRAEFEKWLEEQNPKANNDKQEQIKQRREAYKQKQQAKAQAQNIPKPAESAPLKETKATDNHVVAEGKDLMGKINYSKSKYEFDIETAVHAQGFDGVPRVVSKAEFLEYLKDSPFYAERTYSAKTPEILNEYRSQLYEGKWYVDCGEGGAQYGQGMYVAADYTKANIQGVRDEMRHYQDIGTRRYGFEAFKDGLDKLKYEDITFRYKITKEQFETVKKYVASHDFVPSIYNLAEADKAIYRTIKPKALDEARSIVNDYKERVIRDYKPNYYTESIAFVKGAKILTLYDDVTDISNFYSRMYAYKKLKNTRAKAMVKELIDIENEMSKTMNTHINGKIDNNKLDKLYDQREKIYNSKLFQGEVLKLLQEGHELQKHKGSAGKLVKYVNEGALAAEMGYDAINAIGHGKSGSYTVILNRTKVIICKGGSIYGN